MTENNTIININEDIYNKFYSTLLVEIKKVIKKFQCKKACRKYKENHRDRVNMIQNKASQKYYYNTPGLKEKISNFRKLRYQMDENYRNKRNILTLNYYNTHKEEISRKAKARYQLMKNKETQKMETNDNAISSH